MTRRVTGRRLAVSGTALLALVLLMLAVCGHWSPLRRLDLAVLRRFNDGTAPHPALATFWRDVSTVLQPLTFQTGAVLAAVILGLRGRLRVGLFVAVTVLGAGLISTVVKILVDRPRPAPRVVLAVAKGRSFPSGHALASATTMAVLVLLAWLAGTAIRAALVSVLAVAVAVLVAASRLALGVHYLSDVVGAWVIALAWVSAMALAFGIERSALNVHRARASV